MWNRGGGEVNAGVEVAIPDAFQQGERMIVQGINGYDSHAPINFRARVH